ncbi:MAG: sugar phosphate nucleotidyltransferase, partial [Bacteroidota bacterium]|nr:sugar phosphate nucleotidyltransferase [Bacteroidota bacterium]
YHFSAFSSAFVDILAAEQTPDNPAWYQGTADAVRQGLRHIAPFESDYVLILSGDQLYQIDFQEMLAAHKETGADITIASIPVTAKEASDFGILKTEDSMITSFIEKPKTGLEDWVSDTGPEMKSIGKEYLASMGIYIFNRQLLFDLLLEEHAHATDFGKEIIPDSIEKYKVASYQYEGYWEDIGNIPAFFHANLALTKDLPEFNLFDNTRTIYTRARMLPPAKVSGTRLDRTILADGCIVNAAHIEDSIIGIRSRIGHDTTILSSYIMGSDYYETIEDIAHAQEHGLPQLGVGSHCLIQNVIIDKNCRMGDDVRIIGGLHLPDEDSALYTIKEGIVVIKKGAVLPNGFTLGA